MQFPEASLKMVTVERNAVVCPRCGRRIPGIRIAENSRFRNLSFKCKRCDFIFLASWPGRSELHNESQRH